MNEERALERQAVLSDDDNDPEAMPKGSPDAHNSPKRNESVAKEGIIINSPVKTAKDNVTSSPPAARPSTRSSAEENVVSATTPSPIDGEILPRQKLASKWTREEDACLSKGYQKWGPQWAAIARDSDLCLSGRTSSQVRDRFRSKYPAHYQAAPINRSTKALQKAPRAKANPTKTRLSTDSGTPPPPPGEFKFVIQDSSKAPEPGKHRLLREPSQLDGEKGGPSDHTPSIERDSSLSSQTMVQPSPDPDPDDDDTGSNVSGQRSRPSSVEVEEARHIGVLGLLNDDEEQSGRLPPFKFAFDDDDWGSDSVTLPPLLWEEMSNRPIFEM